MTANVSAVAVSQQLHAMHEWDEFPVVVSCIISKKSYIINVCCQRMAMIEQRGKSEQEIERTHEETKCQRATLAQLIDRVNQQVRIIGQIKT